MLVAREETIQVKVDISATKAPLSALKAEAENLKKAFASIKVADTSSSLKAQAAAAKDNAAAALAMAKAEKEAANAITARARAEQAIENATNAKIRAQTAAQNQVTAQIRSYKEAENAAAAHARAEKAGISTQREQLKLTNQLASGFTNYGTAIASTVKQIVGFTGIAQTFRSAFKEMKSMSDEMVTYRKVTNATAADMEKIRAQAFESSKKYGQSPSDFLAAAADMARAGYGENSAAMADLAIKTKLVGDITADAASKFLLAVDAGYKYKGNIEQLSAVLDAANEIDNNYATSISKISEGMTLVASLAGSANVPIDQLMAALGTMTATTQRSGSEMARGLRYILLTAMKDTSTEIEEGVTVTEDSVKTLDDALNLYAKDAVKAAKDSGKILNPMEKLTAIAKAWKSGKLSEQGLAAISEQLAGKRYYNAFAALIQNFDMYESMLQSVAKSTGSADKEVGNMLDSWSVKLEQVKATWTEIVSDSISENFIKGLLDAGKGALEFAGNLENLAAMASGAYVAIQGLSAGIQNMQKGMKFATAFKGFNAASIGIGLAVTAVGVIKSAIDKSIKDMQESAAKSVSEAISNKDNVKSIESIRKRYNEITSDGIQEEQGELEELKTLQSELNGLVGDQASAIDIVNGKYDETKAKLAELSKEQREQYERELKAAQTKAVNAYKSTPLGAGMSYYPYLIEDGGILQNALAGSQYFSVNSTATSEFEKFITFNKPTEATEIAKAAKEAKNLYEILGSTKLANGKTWGEEYSDFFTEFGDWVDKIYTASESTIQPVEALGEHLDSIADSGQEAGGKTSSGMEEAAKSAYSLADAIKAATTAKEKFDNAMKTSKADGLKDYMTAFKTWQDELKSGKVNSIALHAAARMLLGDEAYAATGGSAKAVQAAMNRRGASGTLSDAYGYLNKEYKDKSGNVIEGYGIVPVLERALKTTFTQSDGSLKIPALTDAELTQVSQAWGGLSKDFIVNAIRALDQYNILGSTNLEDDAADPAIQAQEANTTATEANTDALNAVSEKLDEEKRDEEKGKEEGTPAQETPEIPSGSESVTPDISGAQSQAEALYNSLKSCLESYEQLDGMQVDGSVNPDFQQAISGLKEDIEYFLNNPDTTVDVKEGGSVDRTSQIVSDILTTIENLKTATNNGDIPMDISANLQGDLHGKLAEIIDNVKTVEEIDAIRLTLEANNQVTDEIDALLNERREAIEIGVDANTKEAEKKIDELEERKPEITIDGNLSDDAKQAFNTTSELLSSFTMANPEVNIKEGPTVSEALKSIQDAYSLASQPLTIRVDAGTGLAQADEEIAKLQAGLEAIKAMQNVGLISPEDADALSKTFQSQIDQIQQKVEDFNRNPATVTVGSELNPEGVDQGLKQVEEKETSTTVDVEADPQPFVGAMTGLQNPTNGYNTTVGVGANADEAKGEIAEVEGGDYNANVKVSLTGEGGESLTSYAAEALKKVVEFSGEAQKAIAEYKRAGEALQNAKTDEEITAALDGMAKAGQDAELALAKMAIAQEQAASSGEDLSEAYESIGDGVASAAEAASEEIEPIQIDTELSEPTGEEAVEEAKSEVASPVTIPVQFSIPQNFIDPMGVLKHATGTRYHQGGLAMVNDGTGPELILENGRAFIAGNGRPSIINLSKGAKVFTAAETRSIMNGSGVPAYAAGSDTRFVDTPYFTPHNITPDITLSSGAGSGPTKPPKGKGGGGSKSTAAKVNEKAFSELQKMMDYIIGRIGDALNEQLEILDKQIEELRAAREAAEEQNRLEELQKKVTEAQADLAEALNERTVRYLGEDGKWHWMADQRNVKQAQEALDNAQKELTDYQDELAFNAQIQAIEDQKKALQDEYDNITKMWQDIQDGVNTPTGSLNQLIADVLSGGTAQQKTGANAVKNLLINSTLTKGSYAANYDEALDSIAKATAGKPIMPGDSSATLASLIAQTGGVGSGATVAEALSAAASPVTSSVIGGSTTGGTTISYNYFVNGMQIGKNEAENSSLSDVMRTLTVYSNGNT